MFSCSTWGSGTPDLNFCIGNLVPPVPLFWGLVPPLKSPSAIDTTAFLYLSGTSGTTGTRILRKYQNRLYRGIYTVLYSLFWGFYRNVVPLVPPVPW